jgi:hypothetical protein
VSPADGPLLVWRVGDALLAAPLAAVDEVATVGENGRAQARDGEIPVAAGPLPDAARQHRQAVILRRSDVAGEGRLALPADQVDGVVAADQAEALPAPPWLAGIHAPHMAALVRLETGDIAALLDLAELFREP